MSTKTSVFHATGRKATQPPHPDYPAGLVLDLSTGADRACAVDVAYPSDGIGTWEIRCSCGVSVALTAAGRTDDPRRVVFACGRAPRQEDALRRPWGEQDR